MKMKLFVVATLAIFCAFSAVAGPYADSLGKCLVSSTSAAEKTSLVKWMFITLALHPDVESFSKITPAQRDAVNKEAAQLFEKLMTATCATETRDAVKYEGPATIEQAFGLLGQVAMRELFTNPKVAAGLEDLSKNFDEKKLERVLKSE